MRIITRAAFPTALAAAAMLSRSNSLSQLTSTSWSTAKRSSSGSLPFPLKIVLPPAKHCQVQERSRFTYADIPHHEWLKFVCSCPLKIIPPPALYGAFELRQRRSLAKRTNKT
jgi:hypothetical protein